MRAAFGPRLGCPRNFAMRASRAFEGGLTFLPVASSHSTTWVTSVPLAIPRPVLGAAGELAIYFETEGAEYFRHKKGPRAPAK